MRLIPAIVVISTYAFVQTSDADSSVGSAAGAKHKRTTGRIALDAALAAVPGFVAPGLSNYLTGDRKTGRQLLAISAAGAGTLFAGGTLLLFTRASRHVSFVGLPAVMVGAGTIVLAWLAGIYASATRGRPPENETWVRTSENETWVRTSWVGVGYAYVHDPQFAYAQLGVITARAELGALRVRPSLWWALDADNQRVRVPLSYPVWWDGAIELRVELAATHHRFAEDLFSTNLIEATLNTRAELAGLSPGLGGAFATLSVGYGLQRTSFDVADTPAQNSGMTLGGFGFGVYLGRNTELELYYNHRRDGFAGGISPRESGRGAQGSGFLGHVGARLALPMTQTWSLIADTQLGSAWLGYAALEARWGATL